MSSFPTIDAVYHVSCSAGEVEAQAQDIALEQTVEVPRPLVKDPELAARVIGQIKRIEPLADAGEERFAVEIAYNATLANNQLPQLLNLLYGNISIKNNIRLMDATFPDTWLAQQLGPRFGIDGLRALLGVYGRPILSTAVKPRGSSVDTLAHICGRFAAGQGDLIKDDHNLVDDSFEQFRARVTACHVAVEQQNLKSGRNCLYFPNVCTRAAELKRFAEEAVRIGVSGILISPLLVGLDAVRDIAADLPLVIMTHPTFSGTFFHDRRHGITPAMLLGTLFRLAGADVSVFPNFGGRFGFTADECRELTTHLQRPLGALKPGLPAPAGGMQFRSIAGMCQHYGEQSVFLVGGALLTHHEDVAEGAKAFRQAIEEHFPSTRMVEPQRQTGSACEGPMAVSACAMPSAASATVDAGAPQVYVAQGGLGATPLQWRGKASSAYKQGGGELPFRDVVRHELLGKAGEQMAFDLRYFEINPGGYSSLERHQHTHTIIAVRGRGVLQIGTSTHLLNPHDVAYVPPLANHQLRNESDDQPFGFYCIVDRDRDRPMKPWTGSSEAIT